MFQVPLLDLFCHLLDALWKNGFGQADKGRVEKKAVQDPDLRHCRRIVLDGCVWYEGWIHTQETKQIGNHFTRVFLEFIKNVYLDLLPGKLIEKAFQPAIVEAFSNVTGFRP